jgi:hypothetical protein
MRMACVGAIVGALLSGCSEETQHCTGTVTSQVTSWCEPELWQVPIEVKLDGKMVAQIPPGSSSSGPFDYTNRQQRVELWVGERRLGWRPAACWLRLPEETQHEFILRGYSASFGAPKGFEAECLGTECYTAARTTRQRSCVQNLYMTTAPNK